MSKNLFDVNDPSDDELELKTNKEYADSYNKFRKKELLKKFKDRGYDVSESESSTDDTSSSEAEEFDPDFDKEFFKTLACLKRKDPTIYDKQTKFFDHLNADHDDERDTPKKSKEKKPYTIKDFERNILLERDGKFEDSEDEDNPEAVRATYSPTMVEEEKRLKAEFKQVMEKSDSEDESFGGIFRRREKTKEEADKEEADFIKWLAGKEANIARDEKEKLEPLKNYWNSEKLPQSERFLRDYILNNGYANVKSNEIPTYEEIVEDKVQLSEDEQELYKQAEFEQKYNFRFEEPDNEFIKRFPRTIENSVRRTDEKRKQKRKELKERKEKEKQEKMKEIEILKEMKRKEIEEKIRKLKLVTGNEELGFKDDELEEDFDPEKHDQRMQKLFNDNYYEVDEGEDKPDVPSDIEELRMENWDNYDPRQDQDSEYDHEPHCEDDDFNMDCDYDPKAAKEQTQKELIESTKSRRNRRKQNRFKDILKAEKPPFNPDDEKTYQEYIDEYYKIDCEDIIGDLPCRFKYVETVPNDFGLTIEEILMAKNKELNQWASLKKAVQIRPEHVERKEQRLYTMKAKNEELKRKILKSLYKDGSDSENDDEQTNEAEHNGKDAANEVGNAQQASNAESKKKKKKKRKRKANATATSGADSKPITDPAANEVKVPKMEEAEKKSIAAPVLKNDTKNVPKHIHPPQSEVQNTKKITKKQHDESSIQGKELNPFNRKKTNCSGTIAPLNKSKRKDKTLNSPIKKAKFKTQPKQKSASLKARVNGNEISDERFRAYKINPKKFLKKKQYASK